MAVVYNGRKVLAESMQLEKIKMTPANCNQVNGVHQQIVIKVLIYLEEKVQTHCAKEKGN